MSVVDVILGQHAALVNLYVLDLNVDGDPTVEVKVPVGEFDIITRVIVTATFATASLQWDKFANDTALTNGFYMVYDGEDFGATSPIKNNGDFFNYGYDVSHEKDEAGTPNRILAARWSFNKMSPWGLGMWDGESFGFVMQDDMTVLTSLTSLEAFVEGYKAHP